MALKEQLHPEESEIIAEAHFKLSLALEFASITRTQEDGDESKAEGDEAHVDQGMRDEAVKELELAIKSTKLKLQNKEVELASSHSPDDNDVTRAKIADVKEIVADMEGRVCVNRFLKLEITNTICSLLSSKSLPLMSKMSSTDPPAVPTQWVVFLARHWANPKSTQQLALKKQRRQQPILLV